jgi:hypothetical protein
MSTQNLYLKQISCLQSPVNNQGWYEVVHYSPSALQCLAETAIPGEPQQAAFAAAPAASSDEQGVEEKTVNEPIPWCTVDDGHHDKDDDDEPFHLKRFVYDCSYLSPFVSNVHMREKSANGWFRWVGPDPVLVVRLPLAPAESEYWLFTATIHAFLDEAHANSITFRVNEKSYALEWLDDSTYQSKITSADLYGTAGPSGLAVPKLSIAVPEARQASEQDQRILAFAIRELSLTPA